MSEISGSNQVSNSAIKHRVEEWRERVRGLKPILAQLEVGITVGNGGEDPDYEYHSATLSWVWSDHLPQSEDDPLFVNQDATAIASVWCDGDNSGEPYNNLFRSSYLLFGENYDTDDKEHGFLEVVKENNALWAPFKISDNHTATLPPRMWRHGYRITIYNVNGVWRLRQVIDAPNVDPTVDVVPENELHHLVTELGHLWCHYAVVDD